MMWRHLEILVFVAIAIVLHLALFIGARERGVRTSGAGGEDMVTILTASEQVEAMVAAWKRPPAVTMTGTAFAPPVPVDRDFVAPADQPVQPAEERPDLALPTPVDAPTRVAAPPERGLGPTSGPEPGRPALAQRPRGRATPPEPAAKAAEPVSRKARPTEPARKAPAGAAAQRAAGNGSGTAAGRGRGETSTGASAARVASARETWGARIRNRIERAKLYPAGRRQEARATVALQVSRDGTLAGLSLARSSGIASFDHAALQAVRRAGRFPAAPEELTEAAYSFTVTLAFK